MYQQIKCSSNFFTLLRVLDSIQQILRCGKGSVLAPARGATTCDARAGPKCSGTPRGCQGRGGANHYCQDHSPDAWTGPKCSGTPRGCQGRGGATCCRHWRG